MGFAGAELEQSSTLEETARILTQFGRALGAGFIYIGPRFRQIVPMWIHRLDEANLLAPPPSFNFLLAIDRCVGIDKALVIDEAREVVAASEAGHEFVFVFENTSP